MRQETPSSYLNKLYRTMEAALHSRSSQRGLQVTLNCEKKYQKTSLRLKGTKLRNVSLKRDLITPNVPQLDQSCFTTKLIGKLKFVVLNKGLWGLIFQSYRAFAYRSIPLMLYFLFVTTVTVYLYASENTFFLFSGFHFVLPAVSSSSSSILR